MTPSVEILSRKPISFAGEEAGLEKFFNLECWRVKVGNREDERIIWRRGNFVLVVAVTADNKVVLIHEYKQAVERVFVCLPAGAQKKGEGIVTTAFRELQAETGYTGWAGDCRVLGPFYNSPDKSTERHYVIFVPNVVKQAAPNPEESETILGVELCFWQEAKKSLQIGMHRMALEVTENLLGEM